MNAVSRLLAGWIRRAVEGSYRLDEAGISSVFGLAPDASGIAVTERTAMQSAAVFACVRVIAEAIASCPVYLFERRPDGGRRRASENPLFTLMADSPNPAMSAMVWEETAIANIQLWGNSYSYIEREGFTGGVARLIPLPPDQVTPDFADEAGRKIIYRFSGGRGYGSVPSVIRSEEMLHLVGICHDGLKGLSTIAANRDSIGLDMAQRKFGVSFFGSGTRPGGYLTTDKTLSPEAMKVLREQFESKHQGQGNWHRWAVLPTGVQAKEATMDAEDAQFVAQMNFSALQIARIFRVPPVLLQMEVQGAVYGGGVEQLMIMFNTSTLRPLMVRIEQELNRKLIPENQRGQLFFEHDANALLRGDMKSRYESYTQGRNWGWLSINDVRREENLPPVDGPEGDQLMVPVNMTPASKLGETAPAPAAPPPPAPAAGKEAPGPMAARQALHAVLKRDLKLLVAREVKALRSGLEKREIGDFLGWLTGYYRDFETFSESLCGTAVSAASGLDGGAWAAQLAEESLRELQATAEKCVDLSVDPRSAYQLQFEEWLEHKAERIASAIFEEGEQHAA